MIAAPNTTIHIETLRSGLQYDMMMPVTVKLLGNTMTYFRK